LRVPDFPFDLAGDAVQIGGEVLKLRLTLGAVSDKPPAALRERRDDRERSVFSDGSSDMAGPFGADGRE
jgi:hypothetical protein